MFLSAFFYKGRHCRENIISSMNGKPFRGLLWKTISLGERISQVVFCGERGKEHLKEISSGGLVQQKKNFYEEKRSSIETAIKGIQWIGSFLQVIYGEKTFKVFL